MNKTKAILIAIAAGAALTAGYLFLQNQESAPAQADLQPITILKYSDYQCPACKVMIPLEKQLLADYGELITFEYRHFPLSGHQFAELAARAYEAADRQGRGDAMHEMIFDGQEIWSRGDAERIFGQYAQQLGLDMAQYDADLNSEEIAETVASQRREGMRRLVPGTPTYFINGRKISQTPRTYEQFRSLAELYMADPG